MKGILLLLLLFGCAYDPLAVRYVIDGDTFVLNNGDIIRMQGIDSPEQGDLDYDRTAYELQKRIIGRQLIFEGTDEDMYGRKLRFIFADDKNINIEMVKEGWARVLMHAGTKYEQQLEQAQEYAKRQRKGIWQVDESSYKRLSHKCVELGCPQGTIAVASKQGDVYYNCACSTAMLIGKENIECFILLEEAIEKGLRAARRC